MSKSSSTANGVAPRLVINSSHHSATTELDHLLEWSFSPLQTFAAFSAGNSWAGGPISALLKSHQEEEAEQSGTSLAPNHDQREEKRHVGTSRQQELLESADVLAYSGANGVFASPDVEPMIPCPMPSGISVLPSSDPSTPYPPPSSSAGSQWHQNDSMLSRSIQVKHGVHWATGVLIMSNLSIGIGILNFPHAYASAGGIIPSLCLQLAMYPLVVLSLYMLGYACKFYGATTYQDMVTTHCGLIVGFLCRICMFLDMMGVTIVMIVVLADQTDRVMLKFWGDDFREFWYLRRTFSVPCLCVLVIFPLACLKNFRIFQYTSYLGLLSIAYITFGVTVAGYYTSSAPKIDSEVTRRALIDGSNFWSTLGFVRLLPLLTFAYEGHTEVPIMQSCLRRSSLRYYMRMVVGYLGVATLSYALCGTFACLTFPQPELQNADLLLMYHKDDRLVDVAMTLVLLKAITTIPVYIFCLRTVMDDCWRRCLSPNLPAILRSDTSRRYLQAFAILSMCVGCGVLVPNMTAAISLIGGMSGTFMFILPGMCYLQAQLSKPIERRQLWKQLLGIGVIVWGAFTFGVITTIGVKDVLWPTDL